MRIHTTKPEAKVTISFFTTQDGQRGHLVQVEGRLPAFEALCLAIQALADRLMKFIW